MVCIAGLGCDSDRMTVAPRYDENEEGGFDNRLCSRVYPNAAKWGTGREGETTFLSAKIY